MPAPAPLLQRDPTNPRYFADPSGRAVFLTGSHTWNNLLDKGPGDPPPAFDWAFYLDFLEKHNRNCLRLWSGQIIAHGDRSGGGGVVPLPWRRTGPGEAVDGKPRFDLTAFDASYVDRLRHRVRTAGERGIYVDVMRFEGWCATVRKGDTRMAYHAFAGGNNVNGVNVLDGARDGVYAAWLSLDDPEVVRLVVGCPPLAVCWAHACACAACRVPRSGVRHPSAEAKLSLTCPVEFLDSGLRVRVTPRSAARGRDHESDSEADHAGGGDRPVRRGRRDSLERRAGA